jgi:hypothetical protein
LAAPGSHEQNFVVERIPEYVVDIGRPIDFKESRAAGVWSFRQTSVKQKTQLGELLRHVFSEVFNLRWVWPISHLSYLIPAISTAPLPRQLISFFDKHPNSRWACRSFWSVDSLVDALDMPVRPLNKRNIIRRADLAPHAAHHVKKCHRAHTELVTQLSVGLTSDESPQYDCFCAGQ